VAQQRQVLARMAEFERKKEERLQIQRDNPELLDPELKFAPETNRRRLLKAAHPAAVPHDLKEEADGGERPLAVPTGIDAEQARAIELSARWAAQHGEAERRDFEARLRTLSNPEGAAGPEFAGDFLHDPKSAGGQYYQAVLRRELHASTSRSTDVETSAAESQLARRESTLTSRAWEVHSLGQLREAMHAGRSLFGQSTAAGPEAFFAALDANGSGAIDADEFDTALQRLDVVLTPAQLAKLFAGMDVDGDGRLSYAELLAELRLHPEPVPEPVAGHTTREDAAWAAEQRSLGLFSSDDESPTEVSDSEDLAEPESAAPQADAAGVSPSWASAAAAELLARGGASPAEAPPAAAPARRSVFRKRGAKASLTQAMNSAGAGAGGVNWAEPEAAAAALAAAADVFGEFGAAVAAEGSTGMSAMQKLAAADALLSQVSQLSALDLVGSWVASGHDGGRGVEESIELWPAPDGAGCDFVGRQGVTPASLSPLAGYANPPPCMYIAPGCRGC
jgi:hypothetical protein